MKAKGDHRIEHDNIEVPKRIDGKYILSEIVSVLSFEKGFFYTVKELAIRPGKSIAHFIRKDRSKLIKPIPFIIFSSLIYTVVQHYLVNNDFLDQFASGYTETLDIKTSALVAIFEWIKENYGYTNIAMSIFISFWVKLVFRKIDYNFYEVLTFLLYVSGISTLIYSLSIIAEIITDYRLLYWGGIASFIYSSWALGQIYHKRNPINYFKGAAANLLGMISFYFLAIVLGTTIDMIALNSN